MRVVVDQSICVGHGRCHAVAPDVFELDDLGYSATTALDVPVELQTSARSGAASCPERAIEIIERPATA